MIASHTHRHVTIKSVMCIIFIYLFFLLSPSVDGFTNYYSMMTDEPAKFVVNTSKAGSGALSVTVDGPSKAQLESREVADGHEFTYTPTLPGDYLIIIKFGGNTHIPGSPFRARVTGTRYSQHFSYIYQAPARNLAFSMAGPTVWNSLPLNIMNCTGTIYM